MCECVQKTTFSPAIELDPFVEALSLSSELCDHWFYDWPRSVVDLRGDLVVFVLPLRVEPVDGADPQEESLVDVDRLLGRNLVADAVNDRVESGKKMQFNNWGNICVVCIL